MELCVKKIKSQYMEVLNCSVARAIVRDARPGEVGLHEKMWDIGRENSLKATA